MITIAVPRSANSFNIFPRPGRAGAAHEVDVYDSIDDAVTIVAVYVDGTAETVWQTGGDTYSGYDLRWWQDLADAVAKAVAR